MFDSSVDLFVPDPRLCLFVLDEVIVRLKSLSGVKEVERGSPFVIAIGDH